MACTDRCDMRSSLETTSQSHNSHADSTSALDCSVSWQAPVQDRDGELLGQRAPGDPSNVTVAISGAPNQRVKVANRHKLSGREVSVLVDLDDNGHYRVFSATPVPLDWPIGEWETFIEVGGLVKRCGGFVIVPAIHRGAPVPVTAPITPPSNGIIPGVSRNQIWLLALVAGVVLVAGRR